jgi:hypothetical protein
MENYSIETKRFSNEAKMIMSHLSQNELLQIITHSFTRSLDALITSKVISFKGLFSFLRNTGTKIKDFAIREYSDARTNLKDYAREVAPRVKKAALENLSYGEKYITDKIKEFNRLGFTQKKELLISGLLWIGMVLIIGGGTDFEGGAPDLDIKMGGIGNHRNVFSHTILLALSLEFLLRFVTNLLRNRRKYLPHERSAIWEIVDQLIGELDRNENVMVSGLWVGMAIHLLKDANISSNRVKPYVGIPRELPMQAHQNIYTTNSFLSFIFGFPVQTRNS